MPERTTQTLKLGPSGSPLPRSITDPMHLDDGDEVAVTVLVIKRKAKLCPSVPSYRQRFQQCQLTASHRGPHMNAEGETWN